MKIGNGPNLTHEHILQPYFRDILLKELFSVCVCVCVFFFAIIHLSKAEFLNKGTIDIWGWLILWIKELFYVLQGV